MKDWETKITLVAAIIIVAAMCLGMFFLGRSSVRLPEPGTVQRDTTYLPAPYAVHDTVKVPGPVREIPADTVYYPVPEPVDTAALYAVWLDYYTTRDYNLDFSSDTLGVFKVTAKVNQNKITEAISTIQPMTKVITNTETVYKVKFLQPWVMVGTSIDFNFQQIEAGVDINNRWMVGASGIRYGDNKGFTINAGVKF